MKPATSRVLSFILATVVISASLSTASGERARFELIVNNTWSTTTHPGLFPPAAHFSWLGGGSHDSSTHFWREGELASPGTTLMAETGLTTDLVAEIDAAAAVGQAFGSFHWDWWFCPSETTDSRCLDTTVQFEVDDAYPLVTLATMLGPSPDWFVGVDSLPLADSNGWITNQVVELFPYDNGTRSANDSWSLFGPQNDPPEPISLITTESGQLVGPNSLGQFEFQQVSFECDFDGDLTCDAADMNQMLAEGDVQAGVTGGDPGFDLTGDGIIDGDDINAWLDQAAYAAGFDSPFRSGDANLDGVVDVADFNLWNGGKFTSTGRWDHGDFNGDGVTDTSDFNLWNANKFTSSDITPVPEPAGPLLLLLALSCMLPRRK